MAEFYDYKDVLTDLCKEIAPSRILEWGPGGSTELMRGLCPNAQIISVEHDGKWYAAAMQKYGHIASVYLAGANYTIYPMSHGLAPFDLIFVDGRQRVKCLLSAYMSLNPGGAIVLHDAERERYKPGTNALQALGMAMSGTQTTRIFR